MVNVITFQAPAATTADDINLAGFLEDKIAHLVSLDLITPAGLVTAMTVDADGRMSPFPAGTTGPAAGHIRLVDWQTINTGTAINSLNQMELTVLYLKDSPGKYP